MHQSMHQFDGNVYFMRLWMLKGEKTFRLTSAIVYCRQIIKL